MNWTGILETLKDIKGARFYFLVSIIFLLIIAQLYKNEINVALTNVSFDKVEFRDARDLIGLEKAMDKLVDENTIVLDYTVFLYQPKDKPYFKRMMITTSTIVKSSAMMRNGYLEDQASINKNFEHRDYVLIGTDPEDPETKLLRDLGIEHMIIYRLYYKDVIGEIFITFKRQPTTKELEKITKQLAPMVHIYIL